MSDGRDAGAVARAFEIEGEFLGAEPYGTGHINDTYRVRFDRNGMPAQYVLQRINDRIFKNPAALMENIERVTRHLAAKLEGEPDCERRVLTLIPSRDGRVWHADREGGTWRAYRFIGGARSLDVVETAGQAFQAARAFGRFQQLLTDLPGPRLNDTIPDFHHTPKRFAALERTIEADAVERARLARDEIAFALARKPMASVLVEAGLPERVTHNDTKFNNVLLDEGTGEGLCVMDLDTVMPGWSLCDFGDMVRTATSPVGEDELDLSKVTMQFPMFEALAWGYLEAAGEFLTAREKELLVFSGKLITFEQGVRFLTDYLAGDVYYKIGRAGHNLDRCRAQFRLLESIEQQEDAMERLVERLCR